MIESPITDPLYRPTWLEIDLAALRNNVRLLRNHVGKERTLFAVVKANAYGHGASIIAPAALTVSAPVTTANRVRSFIAASPRIRHPERCARDVPRRLPCRSRAPR